MKTPDEIMGLVVDYGTHCAMAISDAEHGDRTASRKHSTDGRIVFAEIRAALTASMDWQPMDSAPKDGTRVILSWGWKSMVGYYLDNTATDRPWAGWKPPSMEPWPQGQPNAWMPLPPPPAEGEK